MEGGISYLENYILDHKQEQQVLKTNCFIIRTILIFLIAPSPQKLPTNLCVFSPYPLFL